MRDAGSAVAFSVEYQLLFSRALQPHEKYFERTSELVVRSRVFRLIILIRSTSINDIKFVII